MLAFSKPHFTLSFRLLNVHSTQKRIQALAHNDRFELSIGSSDTSDAF